MSSFASPSQYLSSSDFTFADENAKSAKSHQQRHHHQNPNDVSLLSTFSTASTTNNNYAPSPIPQPPSLSSSSSTAQKPSSIIIDKPKSTTTTTTTTSNVKRWGLASVLHQNQIQDSNNNNNNNRSFSNLLDRGISVSSSINNHDQDHDDDDGQQRSCSVTSTNSSSSYVIFDSHNSSSSKKKSIVDTDQKDIIAKREARITAIVHNNQKEAARKVFNTWKLRIQLRRIFVPNLEIAENVNTHLARRISGPLNFLSVYTTFTRWVYHALRRRNAREALSDILSIQREANYSLCVDYLQKWREGAASRRLNRELANMQTRNESLTRQRYLQNWMKTAHRLHNRRIAVRALSSTFYISQCVLMARYFFKFTRYPEEKRRLLAAVEELRDTNHKRFIALTLWRWQRRLRVPAITQLRLIPMRQQAEGVLLQSAFEKWIKWSCNKMTALMLEQRNLKSFGKGFFRSWRRHTHRMRVVLPCLENIRARAEKKLVFGSFHKWKNFIDRMVLSIGLEQKTFILLLQRFYLEWYQNHQSQRRRRTSMRLVSNNDDDDNNNNNSRQQQQQQSYMTMMERFEDEANNNNIDNAGRVMRRSVSNSSPDYDSSNSNSQSQSNRAERRLSLTRSNSDFI